MDISTAKAFLDLGNGLLKPLQEFRDWKKARKQRVSEFLMKISQCLSGIAANAEAGKQIDDVCGELNAYMDALMAALEGAVDAAVLDKYSRLLNAATIQKKLIRELEDPEQRSDALAAVRDAAGRFRGLANVLLV